MWRRDCFFASYTPSNQYLHSLGAPFKPPAGLDYSRFGLIGHNKQCQWGLFGVQWIKPLPVFQVTDKVRDVIKEKHDKIEAEKESTG